MEYPLKTLYVLRHAKSSWDDPGLADHDRPLAPRGIPALTALAAHLRRHRVRPDVILCSTAQRAQQTLEGVVGALGKGPVILMEDALYGADADHLMARLRQLQRSVRSAMIIGHNPGLQDLVVMLSGDGDDRALTRVRRKYATATLATLTFPATWSALVPGAAYLEDVFVPPKQP